MADLNSGPRNTGSHYRSRCTTTACARPHIAEQTGARWCTRRRTAEMDAQAHNPNHAHTIVAGGPRAVPTWHRVDLSPQWQGNLGPSDCTPTALSRCRPAEPTGLQHACTVTTGLQGLVRYGTPWGRAGLRRRSARCRADSARCSQAGAPRAPQSPHARARARARTRTRVCQPAAHRTPPTLPHVHGRPSRGLTGRHTRAGFSSLVGCRCILVRMRTLPEAGPFGAGYVTALSCGHVQREPVPVIMMRIATIAGLGSRAGPRRLHEEPHCQSQSVRRPGPRWPMETRGQAAHS